MQSFHKEVRFPIAAVTNRQLGSCSGNNAFYVIVSPSLPVILRSVLP